MPLRINNQDYLPDELSLAVALQLYTKISEETLSSIFATTRNGLSSEPIFCNNLVSSMRQSPHASHRNTYATVLSD